MFRDWRLVTRRWCVGRCRGAKEPDRSPTGGLGEEHCFQTLPAHQPVLSFFPSECTSASILLISHLPNVWKCLLPASACQYCSAMFAFKLFRSPALCCYCWLTPCSASLSLSPLFSNSLTFSPLPLLSDLPLSPLCSLFLCHCPFPSWSRFCRVGFPLSTRSCWTGAHAECFQSLPQIRNDLPMWILWHCVT